MLVFARDAGRIDISFSDAPEPTANETHSVDLDDLHLHRLLTRFWAAVPADTVAMFNQQIAPRDGEAPVLHAKTVIETVKTGLKRFQLDVFGAPVAAGRRRGLFPQMGCQWHVQRVNAAGAFRDTDALNRKSRLSAVLTGERLWPATVVFCRRVAPVFTERAAKQVTWETTY